jgi:hypothetical protein
MARRRAKSLNKYKKNKKQLGAAVSYISLHDSEFTTPRFDQDTNLLKINKRLDKIKNDLSTVTEDQKDPPCKDSSINWYKDVKGDYRLKPGSNIGTLTRYKANEIRSAFTYPGSKDNIKHQIIPIIGQLRNYAGTKRHVEGFLGGGGSFVAFPDKFTENSIAIEFKGNVAAAHKGFIKDKKTGRSPIQTCAENGYFANFGGFGDQKAYERAVDEGDEETNRLPGFAVTDSCAAYASTKAVQVQSHAKKQETFFIERYKDPDRKKKELKKIDNQTRLYSREGVDILKGSFIDYLDGYKLRDKYNKIVMPFDGDLIYMDPPYIGTEDQYDRAKKDKSKCKDDTAPSVDPNDPEEKKAKQFPKFIVPKDQESCGIVPGEDGKGLNHRELWKKTSDLYYQMNDPKRLKNGNKGIHLAISHSSEGRFHCLIRNYFKKAIKDGHVKACRVDVKRGSSKSRGFFDLPHKDELREQEWLIIVSPHANKITCDEADISQINVEEDKRVRDEMIELDSNRKKCRVAIGEKYLKERVDAIPDDEEATRFLMLATDNKCPPAKVPDWLNDRPGVVEKLKAIKASNKCGVDEALWAKMKKPADDDSDPELGEGSDVCD